MSELLLSLIKISSEMQQMFKVTETQQMTVAQVSQAYEMTNVSC